VGREAVRAIAHAKGFAPMINVAKARVRKGQTTSEEIARVIGEGPAA
jgi:general secretion pathway protein E